MCTIISLQAAMGFALLLATILAVLLLVVLPLATFGFYRKDNKKRLSTYPKEPKNRRAILLWNSFAKSILFVIVIGILIFTFLWLTIDLSYS